ncbi:MAG: hypothetical protein KJ587_15850 [Alphaproteobacteria bacterium]|nr:hypothetical protein [Alphaproteobacteria bacterium]
MSRSAAKAAAAKRPQRQSRFIASVYCAMALAAVCAALGVRAWGGAMGLPEDTAMSVSSGFAVLAVFNLFALSALEFLLRVLHRGEHQRSGTDA